MITIICPTYNESAHIAACVESLLNQDFNEFNAEILFIDGNSNDNTRQIIQEYSNKYPFLHLLDNPKHTVPCALNLGIQKAQGYLIFRIDAHASYPQGYFAELRSYSLNLHADNVGGVVTTLPANSSLVARAVAMAMSNRFGVGNSYFRTGSRIVRKVDTVPFGCFPKDLFARIGLFDEELTRNQDDEFNARICKNGGSIYLIPQLKIDYYARESIAKAASMFFQYGLFKPLTNKKIGSVTTRRQLLPPLFVMALLAGTLCALFFPWARILFVAVAVVYILLSFIFTFKESHSLAILVLMPFVFFIFHVSYGCGYWCGLFKVLTGGSFSVTSKR